MSEEKQEEQGAPENTGKGLQQETISELDRADQIAERQKRENDRREELIKREEALAARRVVGGKADAGDTPKKKSEDEKYAEDAKERYAGMGIDPLDDDTPTTYS
jgi:hypothetical protein